MSKLSHWFPFLDWPRPTRQLLRGEAIAALTVAVVMIPQSVAYAGLAGMVSFQLSQASRMAASRAGSRPARLARSRSSAGMLNR